MRNYNHLLGLCPLLAVSHKLVYGLCLGLCTALVMMLSAQISPRLAALLPSSVRLVVHMLVIAAMVIVTELLLQAWFYSLYQILGLFVPLIITNCAILAHCEKCSGSPPGLREGLALSTRAGLGFIIVLVCVSGLREFFGHGTLFADIELFLGAGAAWLTLDMSAFFDGVPIALMPCGAFFALAVVVASLTALERRRQPARTDEAVLQYHARS
ncbi:MAG: electron transport complex subunit RsxE [Gammaproteobacteria bacterium]|nr:electron transport complex subunit RsxE [Pseudomonadota bacterium]MCH9663515.1 electron transport complex subunit RsxE [Gammaproteobacteria bacterium]